MDYAIADTISGQEIKNLRKSLKLTQAKNVDELKGLFMEIPPIPKEV